MESRDVRPARGPRNEKELIMRLLGRISTAAMLLALAGNVAAAGLDIESDFHAPVVGELSDLSRAIFVGNQAFTADALRRGLRADLDCVIAIQPSVRLDECLRTLESRMLAGYQHAGFPDAAVRAENDAAARHIILRIAEGPRFLCGQVRVTGLKTLDRETVQDTDRGSDCP